MHTPKSDEERIRIAEDFATRGAQVRTPGSKEVRTVLRAVPSVAPGAVYLSQPSTKNPDWLRWWNVDELEEVK